MKEATWQMWVRNITLKDGGVLLQRIYVCWDNVLWYTYVTNKCKIKKATFIDITLKSCPLQDRIIFVKITEIRFL